MVASCAGVAHDHNCKWVREIFKEIGGASDSSRGLLRYLLFSFITCDIWNTTAFNVDTGGLNANIHCLAR